MELHFYPGQYLLAVLDEKGLVLARSEAKGGPRVKGHDPHMAEEPTTPGRYIIDRAEAYRTPTWAYSALKWGTPLQDRGATKDDVWYRTSGGQWGSIKRDYGIARDDILKQYFELYRRYEVPATWIFNDFGPIAIRWFKDLNGNRRLDGKEVLSGQMFHTTPADEAAVANKKPVALSESHGCIHLNPIDRVSLMAMGAFKPGTTFVVHAYDEKLN